MNQKKPRFPIGLPISAVVLIVLGIILNPVIRNLDREVLVTNTILNGIPFILIFVAIILLFITVIWTAGFFLSHKISPRLFKTIETVIIAGIVLGIFGMFQPWWFLAYKIGFQVLLVSTIFYILWSHIIPRGAQRQEEITVVSVSKITDKSA